MSDRLQQRPSWLEDPRLTIDHLTPGQRYTAVLTLLIVVLMLNFGMPGATSGNADRIEIADAGAVDASVDLPGGSLQATPPTTAGAAAASPTLPLPPDPLDPLGVPTDDTLPTDTTVATTSTSESPPTTTFTTSPPSQPDPTTTTTQPATCVNPDLPAPLCNP